MTKAIEIKTVDMHTGGEPVRIVVDGYPEIVGKTILDKRRYAREHFDHLRRLLMHEPRGHFDMYGVLPVEPDHPEADLAVLFIHNEGYSTMCGHGTIALGRWAVDTGLVSPTGPEAMVNIQVPSGLVHVSVEVASGGAGRARYESVPSFMFLGDQEVHVSGHGPVVVDVAFGGAFYALADVSQFGLKIEPAAVGELVDAAWATTNAVADAVELSHPYHPELAALYGTILTDGADIYSEEPTRNVCVFAERQVDRSPTGSGLQARLAIQYAKGLIAIGQRRRFSSILGSEFTGTIVREAKIGHFSGIVAEVAGQSYYTGESSFLLEAGDELPDFLLG